MTRPAGVAPCAIGFGRAPDELPSPDEVGHKARGLALLWQAGIDLPPAFVFGTALFAQWRANRDAALSRLREPLTDAVATLEQVSGRRLGGQTSPLVLSVRSGAAVSMPGILSTILNVGVTPDTVGGLAAESDDDRFGADCLARFAFDFASTSLGVHPFYLDEELADELRQRGLRERAELDCDGLMALSRRLVGLATQRSGAAWPDDPFEALLASIDGVLRSWDSDRAVRYRKRQQIGDIGTAVIVQAMVFGNRNGNSGAGVALSRDPNSGARASRIEFVPRSQGEDLAGGRARPSSSPGAAVASQLHVLGERVERRLGAPAEIEFTVDDGRVWVLQARRAVLSAPAEVSALVDLVDRGVLSEVEALARLAPETLSRLVESSVDSASNAAVARGLGASPGAARGTVVLDADAAIAVSAAGGRPILLTNDLRTDDIRAMGVIAGFVAGRGGLTSHAAVLTRQLGVPCVVSCPGLDCPHGGDIARLGALTLRVGDAVAIDGRSGEVFVGDVRLRQTGEPEAVRRLAEWATAVLALGVAGSLPPSALEVARIVSARFGRCCDRE